MLPVCWHKKPMVIYYFHDILIWVFKMASKDQQQPKYTIRLNSVKKDQAYEQWCAMTVPQYENISSVCFGATKICPIGILCWRFSATSHQVRVSCHWSLHNSLTYWHFKFWLSYAPVRVLSFMYGPVPYDYGFRYCAIDFFVNTGLPCC